MKILSIAIPAYNSEEFLDKNLRTYVYEYGSRSQRMDPRLELIIINDGSADKTLEIAKNWAERFPENIKVIDKENGGHGSGINAGIKAAAGKYFKVIDSDDWIVTENLMVILDALERVEADAVICGYHTVNISNNTVNGYGTGPEKAVILSMEEFSKLKEGCPAAQSFHGIMYRTDFYRSLELEMSEGVFFEDQEYAILPFCSVNTVALFPVFFYEYRIGSSTQSVDFKNQAGREGHFLKVMEKMIDWHLSRREISPAQDDFVTWRLSHSAVSYFATVLVKAEDKKEGREKAEAFHEELSQREPKVSALCEDKYKKMLTIGRMPGASKAYGRLFNSKLYGSFKRRWIK